MTLYPPFDELRSSCGRRQQELELNRALAVHALTALWSPIIMHFEQLPCKRPVLAVCTRLSADVMMCGWLTLM